MHERPLQSRVILWSHQFIRLIKSQTGVKWGWRESRHLTPANEQENGLKLISLILVAHTDLKCFSHEENKYSVTMLVIFRFTTLNKRWFFFLINCAYSAYNNVDACRLYFIFRKQLKSVPCNKISCCIVTSKRRTTRILLFHDIYKLFLTWKYCSLKNYSVWISVVIISRINWCTFCVMLYYYVLNGMCYFFIVSGGYDCVLLPWQKSVCKESCPWNFGWS